MVILHDDYWSCLFRGHYYVPALPHEKEFGQQAYPLNEFLLLKQFLFYMLNYYLILRWRRPKSPCPRIGTEKRLAPVREAHGATGPNRTRVQFRRPLFVTRSPRSPWSSKNWRILAKTAPWTNKSDCYSLKASQRPWLWKDPCSRTLKRKQTWNWSLPRKNYSKDSNWPPSRTKRSKHLQLPACPISSCTCLRASPVTPFARQFGVREANGPNI